MTESVLLWSGVAMYAAGSALFVIGLVFRRPAMRVALGVSLGGVMPHAVAIGVRWERVGHGPYLGFFEVVSALAAASVLTLGLVAWRDRRLEPLGVIIMPVSFLMMGAAMLSPRSDQPILPTLVSPWLVIHIAFAMLAFASLLASFACGAVFLAREYGRAEGPLVGLLAGLPEQAALDDLSFRFTAAGFILLAIMIVAGAIWANEAWGRYWGWDPIETWSLITWLVYAGYMHARLTLGWKPRRSAWYAVIAMGLVVFTLIGVPLLYNSVHGAYIQRI
jgi:cytochrome c-type biogenesis protein CcsB